MREINSSPLHDQHVKDYQIDNAGKVGKENEQRIRDSYNKKFSKEQLEALGKLENAARGIYNNTREELSGLGIEFKEMRGDYHDGSHTYRSPESRAIIHGTISPAHKKRIDQLLTKMSILEETGLIPNYTKEDNSPEVRVITTRPEPVSARQRLARFIEFINSDNKDFIHRNYNPRPSYNINRTQNENVTANAVNPKHYDRFQMLVQITKDIEERAGETFTEALESD